MAHFFQPIFKVNVDPLPVPNTKVSVKSGPEALQAFGFNIPVLITSVPLSKENPQPKSKLVMAHFDTGATYTTIDEKLARELALRPIGDTVTFTAAGRKPAKQYVVDISFPDTDLRGYRVRVNDCELPYNEKATELTHSNFGILIGREIMSKWNIVWNGPSSTVIISD